ncbi:MAG: peptide-methionine (S)-S-oxide reductase MsrA [Clostridia bacterium]|nr:peptide-methionine (S)-S-oxide reductase MsrA [Deltaproteobacteria bacterium]
MFMSIFGTKPQMPVPDRALPGRTEAIQLPKTHFVTGRPLNVVPPGHEVIDFGMGCFWGVERKFWSVTGVFSTAVGYAGGFTKNATYKEVCTGMTGHTEVVRVIYDPAKVTVEQLLATFWENHDPTQGMRQGNDTGTQYRSAIFTHNPAQREAAEATRKVYQQQLTASGYGEITTEITAAPELYYAEDYHQQYLAKNPEGYCGVGGTGVACPVSLKAEHVS